MNDRLRRTKKSAPRNHTVRKIYHRLRAARPSSPRSASCGERHMAAQKRETGTNYIGLLHEETEGQRVADISAAAEHRIMDRILGLVAAMFSRRSEAR